MKYLASLYLLLILSASQCFAQVSAETPNSTPPSKSVIASQSVSTNVSAPLTSEKDYYKMMYEQSINRENKFVDLTDHTLNYVLWLIGVLERQIAKVKSDIDAEVSKRLEAHNINAQNMTADRIFNSQAEFRVSINRELDDYKNTINTSLNSIKDSTSIIIGKMTSKLDDLDILKYVQNALAEKENLLATSLLITNAEKRASEGKYDSEIISTLPRLLHLINEIPEGHAKGIYRIYSLLAKANHYNADKLKYGINHINVRLNQGGIVKYDEYVANLSDQNF
jgi:hypothetical protein